MTEDGIKVLKRVAALIFEETLQFSPGQFNGIQIRTVGRKIKQVTPLGMDAFSNAVDLMGRKIVEDDGLAWAKRWTQDGFQIGQKSRAGKTAVHRH